MRNNHQIQNARWYTTSCDLLNPLLDDVHYFETMMRTLDMTSMDQLNHRLRGINDVKELTMRLDHLNSMHNQISRVPLHVGEDEAEDVVEFHVH